ncbi:hypothetical protein COO60DRAFT_1641188 [Scenedesmus sp. NREL 46B-D3]|nr:hypothetical protein COO60DRAFT_1641188 [Scenedesmus sp. NREL 46B-D3]
MLKVTLLLASSGVTSAVGPACQAVAGVLLAQAPKAPSSTAAGSQDHKDCQWETGAVDMLSFGAAGPVEELQRPAHQAADRARPGSTALPAAQLAVVVLVEGWHCMIQMTSDASAAAGVDSLSRLMAELSTRRTAAETQAAIKLHSTAAVVQPSGQQPQQAQALQPSVVVLLSSQEMHRLLVLVTAIRARQLHSTAGGASVVPGTLPPLSRRTARSARQQRSRQRRQRTVPPGHDAVLGIFFISGLPGVL